jgi:hypothetical protein
MTIIGEIDNAAPQTMLDEIGLDLEQMGAFLNAGKKLMKEAVLSSSAQTFPALNVIDSVLKEACKRYDELHEDVQRYSEALDAKGQN